MVLHETWQSDRTRDEGVAAVGFRSEYDRDVAAAFRDHAPHSELVTEPDLAGVPPVVRRYLRFAGVVDRPRIWNYRLRFRGELRNDENSPWMKMVADQQSFVDPAARFFLIRASMFALPVQAYHRYVGPAATFRVRVASLFTVVNAEGPEMNRSETVTLLNDMCLFAPSTLIDPGIVWEELDPLTVRVTFTSAGNTVSAVLSFDESGALTGFVSDDRLRTADGTTYEQLQWSTPIRAWRAFDGRQLPAQAEAIWRRDDSEFAYARFELLGVEYNAAPTTEKSAVSAHLV